MPQIRADICWNKYDADKEHLVYLEELSRQECDGHTKTFLQIIVCNQHGIIKGFSINKRHMTLWKSKLVIGSNISKFLTPTQSKAFGFYLARSSKFDEYHEHTITRRQRKGIQSLLVKFKPITSQVTGIIIFRKL